MARYIARIAKIENLKEKKYLWREGEDKVDWDTYEILYTFVDIIDYETGEPTKYSSCQTYDTKVVKRFQLSLFVGATIAFDATEKNGKLTRIRNICSNMCYPRVPLANYKTIEPWNNDGTVKANIPKGNIPSIAHCMGCTHWDWETDTVKQSCKKNRLKNLF